MSAMGQGPTPGLANLPLPQTPQVRKKLPAPHARPSITIGGGGAVRRIWRWVAAHRIQVGDVIPDLGRVSEVTVNSYVPPLGSGLTPAQIASQVRWTVTITAGEGNTRTYHAAAEVWCFASATRD